MAGEGKLTRRGLRVQDKSALPDVTVVQISAIDRDGELVGFPIEWDEVTSGKPPRILVHPARDGAQPGRGDRVLVKINRSNDRTYPYEGRIVRKLAGED